MKGSGFRFTERLPPASSPSQALCFHPGSPDGLPRAIALAAFSPLVGAFGSSGLRPWRLRLWPRARSPWVPPAATGGTCWNLTSLTDFCNQHEDRTHPANDRPSPEAAFPTLHPCQCNAPPFWVSPSRGNTAPTVSGAFPKPKLRPDAKDASCAGRTHPSQRARGGAEANSSSFERLLCHQLGHPRGWDPKDDLASQDPRPTSRANGTGLRKSLRRLPLSESRCRELILHGRHPSAARGRHSEWTRLFHDPDLTALTGMTSLEPRRITPKGPARNHSLRGDLRRS